MSKYSPHQFDKSQIDPFVKKQNAKLTQVIQNFFNKAVQIVLQSRTVSESSQFSSPSTVNKDEDSAAATKVNKWFNLHMSNNLDLSKEDLKLWKSCNDLSALPPMIIETYLDLRQLTTSQTVVLRDENGNEWTVAKSGTKKHEVVLERWLIEFDPSVVSGSIVDELPLIYKQAIILFRSIYGFSRLMPAFKLKKRMGTGGLKVNKLSLGNKILDGKQPISSKGRIGLSKTIIPHQMLTTESHVSQKHFQPIQTTLGTLKVSIAYRNHHDFIIHDNEEVLSTHFITIDSPNHEAYKPNQIHESHLALDDQHDAQLQAPFSDSSSSKGDSNDYSDIRRQNFSSIDEELSAGRDQETQSQAIPTNTNREHPSSTAYKRLSISSNPSRSVSPCSNRENSYEKKTTPVPQRPSIQPFKVGSIGNSPPTSTNTPTSGGVPGSLERRVSITSNKSTSNASLAALLRNPRSSTSSTHSFVPTSTPTNTSSTNTTMAVNINNTPNSRTISSSHGSNIQQEDGVFSNLDGASNTPRFSSSFGSRVSRRFSNTSTRQGSLGALAGHSSLGGGSSGAGGSVGHDNSILGTSSGSTTSSGAPLSGLYIDDDISDFVRMIDSKSDLRFLNNIDARHSSPFTHHNSSNDPLSKFQLLKSQHQQFGDSVSASFTLQNPHYSSSGLGVTGSRNSSRKSSHSIYSPPGSLPSGSYDNSHNFPSIHSRLREKSPTSRSSSQEKEETKNSYTGYSSSHQSNTSFLKSQSTNNKAASAAAPVTSIASVHATIHSGIGSAGKNAGKSSGVTGLATTPSAYQRAIHYENVFDDDDDEDPKIIHQIDSNDQESNYLFSQNHSSIENSSSSNRNANRSQFRNLHHPTNSNHSNDDYDDDLLFTMSDMNLTKN